ncbi:methyl-accepting chemotaxis protein [Larsenimonas suaedae]|uniref:PAS domain S-box protein n=1 Tax=Larsenimonas suaedae TaxID=1851019 RepID=A0ABU1GU03_9GAMM|nr:PAS domain S-box protein [Larsenimonas suaedae]MCM2971919.1 PAS domain S-box protein [Larsenimonas suaedae]MDR5895471.1 PAS domain S-box protein [Larsenimonas suaedae]
MTSASNCEQHPNPCREQDYLRAAIDRSQAVVEFTPEGIIVDANQNFLDCVGYELAEIKGKHHRMFCDSDEIGRPEYRAFWQKLGRGEFDSGEYRRIGKGGREIWLQATYNPVLDEQGNAIRVVKFASDTTAQKNHDVEFEGKVAAISRAQAMIEFDLDGIVLAANDNFLKTMGYRANEVLGEHHRMFCEESFWQSADYGDFWTRLGRGEHVQGVYKRLRKNGEEVWLHANYSPILNASGHPYKVVKFAQDITQRKLQNAEFEGKVNAIKRSQAVIEFDMAGYILDANDLFLGATGYRLDEIRGQHHSMFCDTRYAESSEYARFWDELGRGVFKSGEFRRCKRDGSELWLQATYNPIFDMSGRPFKVIKFATDVTERKHQNAELEGRLSAIDRAQAVIEFDLSGNILTANENFLHTMGYSLEEVRGQNHRIFCSNEYVQSESYRDFWKKLGKGEFFSGRFQRLGKFGRTVWIQGTYNPILDANGKPYKIIKFATDISKQVRLEERIRDQALSMNESVVSLNTSINGIAENAGLTQKLASTNQDEAHQGAKTLERSAEVMEAIRKSSEDVDAIVQVIGDIANQTNLLAFNAAIEAARAGEHGLGFSVVADEVRKLAEKSSEATRSIDRLLSESNRRVEEGHRVTREALSSFERIVKGIESTSHSIDEITQATQAQLENAALVERSIHQLTEATAEASERTVTERQ